MSQPEIAWRAHTSAFGAESLRANTHPRSFSRTMSGSNEDLLDSSNRAWAEMDGEGRETQRFDILYLSYKEVKYGAQKTFLSRSVFRPVRGLWYLSGTFSSREGAAKHFHSCLVEGPWTFGLITSLEHLMCGLPSGLSSVTTRWRLHHSLFPSSRTDQDWRFDSEGESLFRIRQSAAGFRLRS